MIYQSLSAGLDLLTQGLYLKYWLFTATMVVANNQLKVKYCSAAGAAEYSGKRAIPAMRQKVLLS